MSAGSDPIVRQEASGILHGLFAHIGSQGREPAGGVTPSSPSSGMAAQLVEFLEMPMDLTKIFLDMGVQLTELVIQSLEDAGIVLARGLVP